VWCALPCSDVSRPRQMLSGCRAIPLGFPASRTVS
jgi:hypothetical protein